MPPTLSVCTAVYNDDRFLARALASVAAQSRPPDQYVVVDDGSTDRCPDIIAAFAAEHSFARPERLPSNQGVIAASERAHQLATGEYIFGFASDDQVEPGFFAAAMEAAERFPDVGVIFGDMRVVDEGGRVLTTIAPSGLQQTTHLDPGRFMEVILRGESPAFSLSASTIYRRRALDETGRYRVELGSWADTFAINTIALRHGACYLKTCGTAWTLRRSSFSQTTRHHPRAALDIVARAAWLMRSDEYRDLYPEEYVGWWTAAMRRWVADDQASLLWHEVVDPFDRQLAAIEPLHGAQRGLVAFQRLLLRSAIKLRNLQTRRHLASYLGDTSCYEQRAE